MVGTPILVLAIALFIVSLLLELILRHLAAKRRQAAAHRPPATVRQSPTFPQQIEGGLARPSQAASFEADAGHTAPGGEPGQGRGT